MAATATVTKDVGLNGVSSIAEFFARGGKMETGQIAFGSALTAGVAVSFNMSRVVFASVGPSHTGKEFQYDITNSKVIVYSNNTALNGTDLSAYSNVPYFAIGF